MSSVPEQKYLARCIALVARCESVRREVWSSMLSIESIIVPALDGSSTMPSRPMRVMNEF